MARVKKVTRFGTGRNSFARNIKIKQRTIPSNPSKKITRITGNAKKGITTAISLIHAKAKAGYYFDKPPRMQHNAAEGILRLKLLHVIRDSDNQITDYFYYILYKNDSNSFNTSGLKVKMIGSGVAKRTESLKITSFHSNNINRLSENGGRFPIVIYGTTGSEFKLSITRKSTGKSMLGKITNDSIVDPIVGKIDCFSGKIGDTPSEGMWGNILGKRKLTLPLILPSATIVKTYVKDSWSSVNKVKFDNLEGVLAGDQLFTEQVTDGTVVTVSEIDPDGDCWSRATGYEVTLSSTVTLTDNKPARFKRSDEYHFNITPSGTTVLGDNIPTTSPTHTVKQYLNPILKLTASASTANVSAVTDIVYEGLANRSGSYVEKHKKTAKYFLLKYTLTPTSGHTTITSKGGTAVAFSSTDSTASSWTNSVSADNGGTRLQVMNISQTGSGTGTYTIKAKIFILDWGNSSVTMHLNLDNILTSS